MKAIPLFLQRYQTQIRFDPTVGETRPVRVLVESRELYPREAAKLEAQGIKGKAEPVWNPSGVYYRVVL